MQLTRFRFPAGLVGSLLVLTMASCGGKEWVDNSARRPDPEVSDPQSAGEMPRIPFGVSITDNGELILVDTDCLGSFALGGGRVEVDNVELFEWMNERPRVSRSIVVNLESPVLLDPVVPQDYEALLNVPPDKIVDVILGFGGSDRISVRRGDLVPGTVVIWDGSKCALSDYADDCTRGGLGGRGVSMTADGRLELWNTDCQPLGEMSVLVAVNGDQRFYWETEGSAMIFKNPDLQDVPWEGVRERSVVLDETSDRGDLEDPALYRIGDLPEDTIIEVGSAVITTRGDLSPEVVLTADGVLPKAEFDAQC